MEQRHSILDFINNTTQIRVLDLSCSFIQHFQLRSLLNVLFFSNFPSSKSNVFNALFKNWFPKFKAFEFLQENFTRNFYK